MQIKNKLILAIALLCMLPLGASAQTSSLNTFSPYSFYGLGDLAPQGNAQIRTMGGAGAAVRDYVSINTVNPAAYSAIPRQTVLFGVGLEGSNFYLRDKDYKSSFNTFNIRDLALQIPLTYGLGIAISVTPYSNVGYRVTTDSDPNSDEVANFGNVSRYYSGSGGLNQYKLGIGWEPWKGRISIGVEMAYYQGNIERDFSLLIDPITAEGSYAAISGSDIERVRTVLVNAGIQANLIYQPDRILTIGGVYRMGGKMRGNVQEYIPHVPASIGSNIMDEVRSNTYATSMNMPHTAIGGINYMRPKYSIALDYTYASWGKSNANLSNADVRYKDTHTVGGGIEWTPNAMNPRNYFKRCTYRVGARYSDYYMTFNRKGQWRSISDKSVSLGIGFPLDSRRRNFIDVGLEGGMRGTTKYGLIQDRYFRISVGVRLFGDDYWFQKYKYN